MAAVDDGAKRTLERMGWVGLAAAFGVLALVVGIARATAADGFEGVLADGWRLGTADEAPAPEELWAETLRDVDCLKAEGLWVLGPFVDAEGAFAFSYRDDPAPDRVERVCSTIARVPSQFQVDQDRRPLTDDARWLVELNGRIHRCLADHGLDVGGRADPWTTDALLRVAAEDPDRYLACAHRAGDR